MSKALNTKSGQYFVIGLAVVVILISSLCWSRLIHQSYNNDVAVVEKTSFRGKANQSGKNIKGKYMFITGVMTAIVKYLPFQSGDN